ncbi:MAG: T9SS type A sorting domain-containing protein [Cyclobacteriaceae bacterium]
MKILRFLFLMIILVVTGASLQAQSLPLDFESTSITYTFTDFEGGVVTRIANPQSSGINTSGFVAKMVKNPGAIYAGSLISLAQPIDFSANRIFKVKVFMPKVGAKMLLKVENATNGSISFEKEAVGSVANAWEELTFDFSTINTTNSYQKIVFIFDLGTAGDGGPNFTYLFDDIKLVSGGTILTPPTLPLDFESSTVNYSFTDFAGGAATRVANPQSSGINTSGFVGKMVKNAGEVYAGSLISLAQPIDFSTNKIFKAKVYMPKVGAKMLLKVENATNGSISFEKEAVGSVANAWEELTFDFSTINTTNSYQKIVLIFDLGTAGDGGPNFTYLFDDIKLVSGGAVLTSPTLPLDFESTTVNYSFTDFAGGVVTRVANPQSGGINTSGFVGKMVKNAGEVYAGSLITLAQPIDFSSNKIFKAKVYMPKVGAKMLLKVENATDGNISFEKEAVGSVANAWEELTFDYSAINTANSYQKIVLIFDLGTAGDGGPNFTYLFDDVKLVSGGTVLTAPTLPLDFESTTVNYSFTDFAGGVVTRVANPQSGGINTSGFVGKMVKNAGEVYAGSLISLAQPIDFSSNKIFKAKVYMPKVGAKMLLKVENATDGNISFEKEVTGSVANAWEELTFDFSTINTANSYQKIVLIFDLGTVGDGGPNFTYLFDDIKLGQLSGTTAQTITFGTIADKTLGDAPFTLAATASSGLAVSYTTTSDKISISGSTVTMTKAGRAAIKANQAGNGTFAAATTVEQSFCIKPAKPTITVTNDDSEAVTLTSSAASGNQWLLNGSPITGSTGTSITVSDAGTYSVRVQIDDCVSANATDIPLVVTGDLNGRRGEFKLFPNPATEYLSLSGIKGAIQEVRITDMAGRAMRPAQIQKTADRVTISLNELPEGLYILNIKSESGNHRMRFIKK